MRNAISLSRCIIVYLTCDISTSRTDKSEERNVNGPPLNREHTLPLIYQICKETGRIDALRLNWKPGMEPTPHIFWDSDIAKWLEAASYSLATHPDPTLEARVDEVIRLLVAAQQPGRSG